MPTHLHSLTSAVMNPHRLLDGYVEYEGPGSAVLQFGAKFKSGLEVRAYMQGINTVRASVRTKDPRILLLGSSDGSLMVLGRFRYCRGKGLRG